MRHNKLLLAVVLAVPCVMAALFHVWTRVTTLELGYQLAQASETHRALLEENKGLELEAAALKAPARLKKLAKERLKLAPPSREQVIREREAVVPAGAGK